MRIKKMRWLASCLSVCLLIGGAIGCGNERKPAEQGAAAEARVITDIAGDQVKVPQKVHKIAVTPLPWASVVYAIDGGAERLGAIHPGAMSAYQGHFLSKMDKNFGKVSTQNINQDFSVNMEGLAEAGTDAVILWKYQEKDAEKLRQMGIPAVRIFNNNVDSLKKSFLIVGKLLGKEERAAMVNAFYDNAYKDIMKHKSEVEKADKPVVLFLRNKKLRLQGNDNFMRESIEIGGGEVMTASMGQTETNSGTITMEEIYQTNPDMILLSNFDSFVPDDIYDNRIPGQDWSSLKAVKNRRVYKVPMGIYRWDAPGVETPLMMKWIASLLQPEIFKDIHVREDTKAFFSDFMKYNLTEDDLSVIFADDANQRSVPFN